MKQKKAFKEVLKGSTITKAMSKAGYADTTASTTGKLTNTKGWQELMDQHMPDSVLAKRHRELLNKNERQEALEELPDGTRRKTYIEVPDTQAVKAALDMAYKLKGRYSDEPLGQKQTVVAVQIIVNGKETKSE